MVRLLELRHRAVEGHQKLLVALVSHVQVHARRYAHPGGSAECHHVRNSTHARDRPHATVRSAASFNKPVLPTAIVELVVSLIG